MNEGEKIEVTIATSKMADKILQDANKQRELVIQKALNTAVEIKNKTQEKSLKRKTELIEVGRKEIDKLKEQEEIKDKIEYKKRIFALQWDLVDSIIQEAYTNLEMIRAKEENYKKYMRDIVTYTIKLFEENEIVIHVDPRDTELIDEIINGVNDKTKLLKVVNDIKTAGGLISSSTDNLKELNETIEFRLKANRQIVREKVYNFLYGDLEIGN